MSTMAQLRQADAEADAAAREEYKREQRATAVPPVVPPVAPEAPEEVKPATRNPDGTPTERGWLAIGRLFRAELPAKQRKGKGGRDFSYIDARQVQNVLDNTVGPGNWSTQVQVVRADHPVAVLVGLSVFGVWKWDAGYSNNPEADNEQDKAFEDEPLKAAVSDGFKRAAVQFGIGRFLYS